MSNSVAMIDEEVRFMSQLTEVVRAWRESQGKKADDEVVDQEAAYALGYAMGARFSGAR